MVDEWLQGNSFCTKIVEGRAASIELKTEELLEMEAASANIEVVGTRYTEAIETTTTAL